MREVVEILFRHRHAIWAMNEVSAYDPQVQAVFAEFMDHRTREIQRTLDQLAGRRGPPGRARRSRAHAGRPSSAASARC
jgi:hypothetical protein